MQQWKSFVIKKWPASWADYKRRWPSLGVLFLLLLLAFQLTAPAESEDPELQRIQRMGWQSGNSQQIPCGELHEPGYYEWNTEDQRGEFYLARNGNIFYSVAFHTSIRNVHCEKIDAPSEIEEL